jgi:hypothetical protein
VSPTPYCSVYVTSTRLYPKPNQDLLVKGRNVAQLVTPCLTRPPGITSGQLHYLQNWCTIMGSGYLAMLESQVG